MGLFYGHEKIETFRGSECCLPLIVLNTGYTHLQNTALCFYDLQVFILLHVLNYLDTQNYAVKYQEFHDLFKPAF